MSQKILLTTLLGLTQFVYADTNLKGEKIDLFSCEIAGKKHYATSIDNSPGKCVALPPMGEVFIFIAIAEGDTRAGYLDRTSVKKEGNKVELDLLLIKPDTQDADKSNDSTPADFDWRIHKIFFCDIWTQTSTRIELYKNTRTTPLFIQGYDRPTRTYKSIANDDSIDAHIVKYVCS